MTSPMDELRQASADLQPNPHDALRDAYSSICATPNEQRR